MEPIIMPEQEKNNILIRPLGPGMHAQLQRIAYQPVTAADATLIFLAMRIFFFAPTRTMQSVAYMVDRIRVATMQPAA